MEPLGYNTFKQRSGPSDAPFFSTAGNTSPLAMLAFTVDGGSVLAFGNAGFEPGPRDAAPLSLRFGDRDRSAPTHQPCPQISDIANSSTGETTGRKLKRHFDVIWLAPTSVQQ
jgi:hypothetical protein